MKTLKSLIVALGVLGTFSAAQAAELTCPNGGKLMMRCMMMNAGPTDGARAICNNNGKLTLHEYWLRNGQMDNGVGQVAIVERTSESLILQLSIGDQSERLKVDLTEKYGANAQYEGSSYWQSCH